MSRGPSPTKVLLVEDEILISAIIADELRERGFDVHDVTTGDEALRYIEAGYEADIIFTDINLPGNIDGIELAIRVREIRPELPIVYASGRCHAFGLESMVTRSLFVPKPYSPAEVCSVLARLTDTTQH